MEVRNKRNKMLRNLSFKKMDYFTQQHYNTTRPVLFEQQNKNGFVDGYTDNYIKVTTHYTPNIGNHITPWKLR